MCAIHLLNSSFKKIFSIFIEINMFFEKNRCIFFVYLLEKKNINKRDLYVKANR
ncbi:hypothetical protein RV18_GL000920 [Enterococcus termitis]|nr:hypothetical protein RV18_GL000920 [Enterococcus termitis]